MNRERYDEYIRRFNEKDLTAFDEFIAPNMRMQNGTLVFHGVDGMKNNYDMIWKTFSEDLTIERFVSDGRSLAVQMWAHFTALKDDPDSLFGPVVKGETFDFRGLIMYQLEDGKFADIRVAYNSFTNTKVDGQVIEMGIPH